MTAPTAPSIASLEAVLADKFPSLRKRCLHCGGKGFVWEHQTCSERHCHGLGYVPAITTDGLVTLLLDYGFEVRFDNDVQPDDSVLAWCRVLDGEEFVADETAPTPRESIIRAAVAALGQEAR